jgi:hypothetical protein
MITTATAASIPGNVVVLGGCLAGMLVAMFTGARHGYWNGALRQIAPTVALVIASFVAWAGGPSFGHVALRGTTVPWLLRGLSGMLIIGCIVWLIAFSILWRIGRNRTPNPTGEVERPVLGAIAGCWTGIAWSMTAFLIIAALGSFAQFWLTNTPTPPGNFARPVLVNLVRVKNSLALVKRLSWLEAWNPMPAKTQRTLEKGMRVLNSPATFARLRHLEPVRAIASHPAFYPLMQNTEIWQIIAAHDVEKLVTHPAILHLIADDDFQRMLSQVDLEELFTKALGEY